MTRGGGQRLDSGEAVLHSHEVQPSFLIDASSEPAVATAAISDLDPNDDGATPARVVNGGAPAYRLIYVRASRVAALGSSAIPRLTGRAPPAL